MKHGHARRHAPLTTEYRAWQSMWTRVRNPNRPQWKDYGGRGIRVWPVWKRFDRFLADVGLKPHPAWTLDRIHNDGHYAPGNVRWASRSEQRLNSRPRPLRPHGPDGRFIR